MKTTELFESANDKLTGYIDIPALAHLLPDITNPAMFDEALDKLRLGQATVLTVPEKIQLALAFVSLVGLNATQKTQVMRMLSTVHAVPANQQQQTQQQPQPQRPTNQPS